MKLVAFFLFVLSMGATADVVAQKIDLQAENASMKSVLMELTKKTGYSFVFKEDEIEKAAPVSIDLKQKEIGEILLQLFSNQPFTYNVKGKIVSIKPKISIKKVALAQSTIRGRVTDSVGNGLEGVVVELEGTSLRTATDKQGYYVLSQVLVGGNIVFRLIGYETFSIFANRPEINVILQQLVSQLDEVFVERGYYTVAKRINTGSVSTVDAEALSRQPVNNPIIALQGRIPGMYIAQESGIPGAGLKLQLRGRNSIANGNDPLYIVDGVPFPSQSMTTLANASSAASYMSPLASINMDNIESIDVLKDADATAIYGSRGANGVILISTKQGKVGKTAIDINLSSGLGQVASKYNLLDSKEYLQMRREAFENDQVEIGSRDYDLNGAWGDINRYTDWQDLLIGNNAELNDSRVNISGGGENTQFLLGGSWRRETTVFPGDFRNVKLGTHFNITHRSENKRFHVSIAASYLKDNNRLPTIDFTQRITLAPNAPKIYNEDGSLNWQNSTWQNPLGFLRQSSTTNISNLNSSLTLSYDINDAISIKGRFGYNEIDLKDIYLVPFSSINPALSNPEGRRQHRQGQSQNRSWIIEPTLTYNKQSIYGKFESLIGLSFQESTRDFLSQTASGFSSDAIIENIQAATTIRISDFSYSKYRYNAIFARFGYSFANTYVVNLTARRDGSSRFSKGRQFGNFGAIGVAWIFTEEEVIRKYLPFLSFGKVRGSYGISGNDQTGDYQYLSRYSSTSDQYQGTVGFVPVSHTSVDYGWENVRKLEAAMELGLFKDQLNLNLSLYKNLTTNQLVGYPLPNYTGFASVTANLPAVIQNTGIEIDGSVDIFRKANFQWNTTGNINFPRNKLISYPNFESSPYVSSLIIGQPLSLRPMYEFKGINQETGLYSFADLNQDGSITYDHDTRPMFLGQRYFGGLSNTFVCYGFHLNVHLQFVKQNGYRFDSTNIPGTYSINSNISRYLFENRTTTNEIKRFQELTQDWSSEIVSNGAIFNSSNGMVTDASFIRLKNVSLSYQLPENVSKVLMLKKVQVFLQAQNLLTISKLKDGDPENSLTSPNSINLPPLRMTTMGIQISL